MERQTPLVILVNRYSSTSFGGEDPGRPRISRDPRREEHTIWTAVAPGDVPTVRTYGDTRPHDPAPRASAQMPRRTRANPQARGLQPAKLRHTDKSRGR